jgi:hypothetical protein
MHEIEYILIIIFLILGWMTNIDIQKLRLIDVIIYGPILLYSGFIIENLFLKIMLLFIGSTTISYNLRNYFIYRIMNIN